MDMMKKTNIWKYLPIPKINGICSCSSVANERIESHGGINGVELILLLMQHNSGASFMRLNYI